MKGAQQNKKPGHQAQPQQKKLVPGLSKEDEERQLALILSIAEDNLAKAERHMKKLSDELYDLMETYGPKDKEALALFHNTQSQLLESRHDLIRCQKAGKKPYFGRIDFRDKGQAADESYYIGRAGISQSGQQPVVIDWRAPVASVYYEGAIGPCSYTVKNEGIYHVDLKRKRTYEIEQGRLKDFYDSDVVANDELLTQYLAKNKKAVLGEIIATIQKEQNAVIRKSPKTNLIVQGVAGSGKTTVAMHRISYILYNYAQEYRPQDFYIIGSNQILLNYITSVLPDLDVYGVSQMTMEQLFVRLLYEDWDAGRYHIKALYGKDKKTDGNTRLKGSYGWFRDLTKFCAQYEKKAIPLDEIRITQSSVLLMDGADIKNYIKSNPKVSMQGKINMLNEILLSRLENELSGKYVSYSAAGKKELQRACRWHFGKDAWKGSVFELYKEFIQWQAQNGKSVPMPEDGFDVYDLAALAYLYKRIKETDGIREASHVIIDEAQDFGMMAYGALAYCLRGCTYTVMGDVSQNIYYGYGLDSWEELQELLLTGTYDSFGLLKKSYRNTVEIARFALEILRHGDFPIYPSEPINRHGKDVNMIQCKNEEEMLEKTVQAARGWLKGGRETVAVICRDESEAETVIKRFALHHIKVFGISLESEEYGSGIMALPVEYTKGLEFDAVMLYNPSGENYPATDGYVKLLYVAATRALHELAVIHMGNLTDLIAKPVSGEKRLKSLEHGLHKEARRYGKKELTAKEQELLKAKHGEKERALRSSIGPRPVAVQKPGTAQERPKSVPARKDDGEKTAQSTGSRMGHMPGSNVPVNLSPYQFGECPDASCLRPLGHGRIDCSVRIVKKEKGYVDLVSSYGTLRLSQVADAVLHVQFQQGGEAGFKPGYWERVPQNLEGWAVKEQKGFVEACAGNISARVDKKTGAVQFYGKDGKLLTEEKAALPRQIGPADTPGCWEFFEWQKNEKIYAKGMLADSLEWLNKKARYISFGGKKMRMPLLVSGNGYGIGIAGEKEVLCCTVPMYGQYFYFGGTAQIDYYFLYDGKGVDSVLGLYKKYF